MKQENESAYQIFHEYVVAKSSSPYIEKNDAAILCAVDAWAKKNGIEHLDDLDEFVFYTKSPKESVVRILLEFYDSVPEKVQTSLKDMVIIDDPTRRIMEEVKYLHKPRTMAELTAHFGRSEKGIQRDLNMLRDGVTVMDSTIRIITEKRKGKTYLRTFGQPVFMVFSEMECEAITKGLGNFSKQEPVYGNCLYRIAKRYYGQFSDEVKAMIDAPYLEEDEANNDFNEETLAEMEFDLGYQAQLLMMLTEGKQGRIDFSQGNNITTLLHCKIKEYDVATRKLTIIKKDKSEIYIDASWIVNCAVDKESRQ